MRARISTTLILLVATARLADAQLCLGQPDLSAGPLNVGGAFAMDEDSKGIGAQAGFGAAKGAFGSVQVLRLTADDDPEIGDRPKGTSYGGTLGYALSLGADGRARVCPLVGVTRQRIEGDFLGETVKLDADQMQIGGAVAYTLPSTGNVAFTPFAGISYAKVDGTVKVAGEKFDLDSESYTPGVFGLGMTFNQRAGVYASATVPFGLEDGITTYALGLQFVMGRRR